MGTIDKAVYVEWTDSMISTHGWKLEDEIDHSLDLNTVKTVGFILYEDEEKIVLAGDVLICPHDIETQSNRRITIPKVVITFMRPIDT